MTISTEANATLLPMYVEPMTNGFGNGNGSLKEIDLAKILCAKKNGGSIIKLRKGQKLFEQGQNALALYWIKSGKIKLTRHSPNGNRGWIPDFIKAGDFIGWESLDAMNTQSALQSHLRPDERYDATARAMEASEIVRIPRARFFQLGQTNPEILFVALNSIAKAQDRADTQMYIHENASADQRVALTLQELKNGHNVVPMTVTDIAWRSGISRHTLYVQVLPRLVNLGQIETTGKSHRMRVKILNPEALAKEGDIFVPGKKTQQRRKDRRLKRT